MLNYSLYPTLHDLKYFLFASLNSSLVHVAPLARPVGGLGAP